MPTRIDWCDETLNPLGFWCFGVGGTRDNPNVCSYCYAKRIAQRNMVKCEKCRTFNEPHTHFEVLEKLSRWKKPRNIFVQSMGDLFHPEVPDYWIDAVLAACEKVPRHNYLFLTKNPHRYRSLAKNAMLPERGNMWFGSTATNEDKPFWWSKRHKTFVSIEPIIEYLMQPGKPVKKVDWVIVGAETGNRKGKIIPQKAWIDALLKDCKDTDVPLFMKESLRELMGKDFVQEFPNELKKINGSDMLI